MSGTGFNELKKEAIAVVTLILIFAVLVIWLPLVLILIEVMKN